MIDLIFKLLRLLEPEISHVLSLKLLKLAHNIGLLRLLSLSYSDDHFSEKNKFSYEKLKFKNRLGIAAGIDKNGDYIDALGALGFGFLEIGTVTPKPQLGNPKPRVFRDQKNFSVINRLGFNNKGVKYVAHNLKKRNYSGVVGANIGANKNSVGQDRINDYIICIKELHQYVDYFTINISSPNTPNLRDLHSKEYISDLLASIKHEIEALGFTGPILIKISPDEQLNVLENIIQEVKRFRLDGIIATNSSTIRPNKLDKNLQNEEGGLSGKLIYKLSTDILEKVADKDLLIIGVGGVFSKDDFKEKISNGANLVQVYSGFIFKGPSLIKTILG